MKNIVFCADGTWNAPDQDEDKDEVPDWTNVFKLYLALKGNALAASAAIHKEAEYEFTGSGQIAKYVHGVGDSNNPLHKVVGGAFGAGVIKRIARGYTYISRNYQAGDAIFIIGFSRGAYTARALAGLIAGEGLLRPELLGDREKSYQLAAAVWYRYRQKSPKASILAGLAEMSADLSGYLRRDKVDDSQLVKGVKVRAVGVWDTVGALGIPRKTDDGRLYDAYAFADTVLGERVEHGFHAVSCDEQRRLFAPTLWLARSGITQLRFPGAHADVGGGYPRKNGESGLSDIALVWLAHELRAVGLQLDDAVLAGLSAPDAAGVAHQPWRHKPWDKLPHEPRAGIAALPKHPSVDQRCAAGPVVAEPGGAPASYVPACG